MSNFEKVFTPARIIYLASNGGEFDANIYHLLSELVPYFEGKGETFKNTNDFIGSFICIVLNNYDCWRNISTFKNPSEDDLFLHAIFLLVKEISDYRGYIDNNDLGGAVNATRNIIGYAFNASGYEHELTIDEINKIEGDNRKYKNKDVKHKKAKEFAAKEAKIRYGKGETLSVAWRSFKRTDMNNAPPPVGITSNISVCSFVIH
jgi:hypothetical protein